MSITHLGAAVFREEDPDTGDPLAGGKVYFYEVGTTTPKTTWSERTGTTANAHPVVLDAGGRADIFIDGDYTVELKKSDDTLIYTADIIGSSASDDTTSQQIFTTSNTWTKPADCVRVLVEVWGAGGGGGGAAATSAGQVSIGAGGGAGGYSRANINVEAISTATITIGSGGSGNSGAAGSAGGDSTWADGTYTITAKGGSGGGLLTSGDQLDVQIGGSGGLQGSGGDLNVPGENGGHGQRVRTSEISGASTFIGLGGQGGSSSMGRGGKATRVANSVADSSNGTSSDGKASGGGGAASVDGGSARSGGTATDGLIIVTEFY